MPVRDGVQLTVVSPFYMHSIQLNSTERTLAPWLPTVLDIMADDWMVWEAPDPATLSTPAA